MRLVQEAPEVIDSRRVTPEDVLDAVSGSIESGRVEHCIAITESADGVLEFSVSDMTNTQFVGTLTIAMQNYIHTFQHKD